MWKKCKKLVFSIYIYNWSKNITAVISLQPLDQQNFVYNKKYHWLKKSERY